MKNFLQMTVPMEGGGTEDAMLNLEAIEYIYREPRTRFCVVKLKGGERLVTTQDYDEVIKMLE